MEGKTGGLRVQTLERNEVERNFEQGAGYRASSEPGEARPVGLH